MPTPPVPLQISQAFSVRGQAVLITGAAGYIGSVIAETFAANGAKVLLTDRQNSPLTAIAQRLRDQGHTALDHPADLRSPTELQTLLAVAETHLGTLDTLIHCGGIPYSRPIDHQPDEDFDAFFQTNLRSTWLLVKYLRPLFIAKGGGNVINIASVNGHRAMFHGSLYIASKAAMLNLTRELSSELGPYHIRVNSVSPGVIDNIPAKLADAATWFASPFREKFLDMFTPLVHEGPKNAQPLPLGGLPLDVAMACIYLASPAARFISGADLLVDGGFLQSIFCDLLPPKARTLENRVREYMRNLPDEGWAAGKPPFWLKK